MKRVVRRDTDDWKREEGTFIALQRAAEILMRKLAEELKPSDLTPTQYNVLRILRGAGAEGIPCGEVSARMVTHDPDITRLLDRLEARSLVSRTRSDADRRVIYARIAPDGLALLAELDGVLRAFMVARLGHLGRERLDLLRELLTELAQ
jgi:DNA-binding MarR family transcriptional regulator